MGRGEVRHARNLALRIFAKAAALRRRDQLHLDGADRSAAGLFHVAPAAFEAEVAAAFAMWEAEANVSFARTDDVDKADILIGAEGNPAGYAFTNVAYDRDSAGSVRRIAKSLICLNPTRHWKVGFDGNLEAYDLRYAMAHEIGHAIGLDHPSPSGELMSFRYGEDFRELRPGDARGAVALTVRAAPRWSRRRRSQARTRRIWRCADVFLVSL